MKVLYVYGNLPAYRKAFFTELYDRAGEKDIRVKILYGYIANKETKQATDILFDTQKLKTQTMNLGVLRLSRMKGLLRQIKKEQPDGIIFQWNQTNLSEWAVLCYCKRKSIPYGLWGCNYTRSDLIKPLVRIRERLYQMLYRNAAVLIPYGSLYKKYLLGLNISADKIIVAQNTIDVESIVRDNPNRTIDSFDHETVRILFVGALAPQKRIDKAIEAISQLIIEGVNVSFDIVGGGQSFEELKSQLMRKPDKVRSRITLHGAKYGDELKKFFLDSDVFLMPGTGGLGVNEAMAYGLPIISTIGDETVFDLINGNGYLISKMGSVKEQIDYIRKFVGLSKEEKLIMSQKSVELVTERASLNNMVSNHVRALESLVV